MALKNILNAMRKRYKSKQSEKATERYAVAETTKRRGLCLKVDPTNHNGVPDRLILLPGSITFFIEFKSEGEKPRPLQDYMANKIEALGTNTYVADTKERVDEIFKIWDDIAKELQT